MGGTIEMKIWKSKDELAKHGRYGDTMMKKIDGDLAHVNPVEYEMSPEYIKEHGSGTINPITGKKEYIFGLTLGGIAAGLSIGGSIMKGFGAWGAGGDVKDARAAAEDIYQEQLGLLGERKTSAEERVGLGYDIAESQYAGGVRDVSMGTQVGMRDIGASADIARSRSGLATSGTIEQKAGMQTGDLMAKYKSDMTKLFETREFAGRERAMGLAEADLSFRSGKISAEDAYQNTKTGLESQPTGFLEGMFS